MTGTATRPRIRHNDYSPLSPPEAGHWTPSLPVSVVIPAHGNQPLVDLTLAALSAQTYPAHLTEVVVVDDGSLPPLRLPKIRPENTRIIRSGPGGWGPAFALNAGIAASEGTVVQRLDADMVVYRDHLERLLRWHHLTDYLVTIGAKVFVEPPALTPEQIVEAVARDRLGELIDLSQATPSSTERTILRLDGMKKSRNPYHVVTGPTLSLHRTLLKAVGGLDAEVHRGEDTEFAYRLAQGGAVFVPDLSARAVHMGVPAQKRNRAATVKAVEPYHAQRIPLRRDLRKQRGRTWHTPYIEVVFDVSKASEREVRDAVESALTGSITDVRVLLTAPWSSVKTGRGEAMAGQEFELRLISESMRGDPRVHLAERAPATAFPVPFRYRGSVHAPPAPETLERMTRTMTDGRLGVLVTESPAGTEAVMERTEAVSRALLLARPGETPHDVIRQTHGVRRTSPANFWPRPDPGSDVPQEKRRGLGLFRRRTS
ncbi:glycosyltransferase family 2 protein [Herbidospora galbida]|uniref:Glycosyltransferase family 2 protein n=1 Tax=Herbidospora galbida TaxID=2575442 RepID=A0A4U3MMM0_9ACTN|nr:glycosyltransferase family 2 protein [Herbidospora galbida]